MRKTDKINKYEHHNARSAERRTKLDFRVKSGRYARTVNPLAKTPNVQIKNVPSDILDAIDELAARQDRSRSSFVRHELQRIVAGQAEAA